MMKRVIIESHIPYVPDDLSRHFDIIRLSPDEINTKAVTNADALIVRTRTRCDASLLDTSRCQFIATATIGTDHLDLPYLCSRGITAVSAPGCNAPAVAQYVLASLLSLFPHGLAGKTIGVVGVGHVGSIVADWSRQLGMNVLLCDPPRQRAEGSDNFTSLDSIASRADIITFHTPHTLDGPDATHHLADAAFFDSLRRQPVIVNSARGPITDTPALISALDNGKVSSAVIDCWENEPDISRELLTRAAIATPHIAGYSLNGKIRATAMAINALCEFFDVDFRFRPSIPSGAAQCVSPESIISSYNPVIDSRSLKSLAASPSLPLHFEHLRNSYRYRPEVP